MKGLYHNTYFYCKDKVLFVNTQKFSGNVRVTEEGEFSRFDVCSSFWTCDEDNNELEVSKEYAEIIVKAVRDNIEKYSNIDFN